MAKKVLYKVAFHGGFNNIWSSLMTIPEVNYTIPNQRKTNYQYHDDMMDTDDKK